MPLSLLYLGVKVHLSLLAAHTLFHAPMSNSPFSGVEDDILEVDAKLVVPLCFTETVLLLLIIAVTLTAGSLERVFRTDVTVNLTTAVANSVTAELSPLLLCWREQQKGNLSVLHLLLFSLLVKAHLY